MPDVADSSSPGNSADDIDARIAALAALGQEAAEPPPSDAEGEGAETPFADTAELEAFLTAGLLRGIEWVYESRATVAGEHWKLNSGDVAVLEPPAARVVAKWAPKLARFVPSIAWKCKEELALIVVVWRLTSTRVALDRTMPPAPEKTADAEGGPSDDR